jgi:hypothetical protein
MMCNKFAALIQRYERILLVLGLLAVVCVLFYVDSEWVGKVNVFFTAVFAALTFFIVRANREAVEVMREQMANQNRPFVTVSVRARTGTPIIRLSIKNVGRSPAQNLRLHIDRDFFLFNGKKNLADMSAFTQSINSLPPTSELLFELGRMNTDFGPGKCPYTFMVSAEYDDGEKKYSEKTDVDLYPYNNPIWDDPLVETLVKIEKSIDKLHTGARPEQARQSFLGAVVFGGVCVYVMQNVIFRKPKAVK